MQLPLSASALVPVGAGAVLAGVLILVFLAVRRRRAQSPARSVRATGGAGAPRMPPPPPVEAPLRPAVDAAQAAPAAEAAPAPVATSAHPAADRTGFVQPAPEPQVAAEPVGSTAAAPYPVAAQSAAETDPIGRSVDVPVPARAAVPASFPPQQAGSTRTVAAAVAQAFAVRAAASRTGGPPPTPLPPAPPTEPPPTLLPPPDRMPRPEQATQAQEEATAPEQNPLPADLGTNGDGPAAAPHRDRVDGQPVDGVAPPPPPAADTNGWLAATSPWPAPAEPEQAAVPPDAGAGDAAGEAVGDAVVPPPRPEHVFDGAPPRGTATDARDRLLAVLLDDPERAVGAAVELETCLRELDRLSEAVRHERVVLRDVLRRLAAAGLRSEQLARLAGMPLAEVEALLGAAPVEQEAQAPG